MGASSERTGRAAPTSSTERWLIQAAKAGDRQAENYLVRSYEPLLRSITRRFYLPGGQSADLVQEARVGVVQAIKAWDPSRRVPFASFAALCARRNVRMAVTAAYAHKHEPLNDAERLLGREPIPLKVAEEGGRAVRRRHEAFRRALAPESSAPQSVAEVHERLVAIRASLPLLSHLERCSLIMAQAGCSHREIAAQVGADEKAVNNALQRVRHKLAAAHPMLVDGGARGDSSAPTAKA